MGNTICSWIHLWDVTDMKPMLAGKVQDIQKLSYPLLVSPKLDGIRALVVNGTVVSRNLKAIPNEYVQQLFSKLEGYDGELIVGNPNDPTTFRDTTSGVMSREGKPNVWYHVFDRWDLYNSSFRVRYSQLSEQSDRVIKVPHHIVSYPNQIDHLEEKYLEMGYEGLMIRGIDSPYKYGRSTEREAWLLKLKRFEDSEALVIGVEEKVHNGNEATINALGHKERSSHIANRKPLCVMGALIVRDVNTGVEFNIGTGFTDEDRIDWWELPDEYSETYNSDGSQVRKYVNPSILVKYKYFASGSKDKPRFPVFLGIRSDF